MPVTSKQVSITTTATLIHTAIGATELIVVDPAIGTSRAFFGDSGVTTSNGFVPRDSSGTAHLFSVNLTDGDSFYAVRASGMDNVTVLVVT